MYRNILCPIDGSPTSLAGMKEAIALAQALQSRIRFIFVLDTLVYATASGLDVTAQVQASGQAILEQAILEASKAHVEANSQILETAGTPVAETILEDAKNWKAHIIVLGTHARRGISRLMLGSDAENVVTLSKVPVLLVRQA